MAQAVSFIGDRLTQVALMIYVVDLAHGSATAAAMSLLVQSVPVVLIGPLGGVFIDRWDKRRTMVACDLLRAVIIAVVPFLGDARLVYVIAFLMSAVTAVFTPSLQASLPELLEDKREILVANSLIYSTKYFTDILGFGVAGIIIAATGVRNAFLIDAASFLISALFIVRITKRLVAGNPRPVTARGVWNDLVAGIRYHRENLVVLSLLISFSLGVLAMGGLNALLMVGVERLLQVGAYWWSFLLMVQAVAMFASAGAIGRWAQKVPKPYLVLPGFLGIGLCAIGLSLSHTLPLAFLLYAVLGAANSAFLVPSLSWIQEIVPFEFRGRVFSLRNVALNLAAIISYAVAGPLGDRVGVAPVMAGVGVLLCLTTVLSAFLPGFREVFRPKATKQGVPA